MKKILIILGTRPEAIKLYSLIKGLKREGYDVKVLVIKQQDRLLDEILEDLRIKSDFIFYPTKDNNYNYCTLMSEGIEFINKIIKNYGFDLGIVQGDTTTALIGGLACKYNGVKLIHIESGLRTWDINDPFPEEMHRIMIDEMSDYKFCPTKESYNNLRDNWNSYVVGNTGIDTLMEIKEEICKNGIDNYKIGKQVLVTIHRRENFNNTDKILDEIINTSKNNPELNFKIIRHSNPNIKWDENKIKNNIELIESLNYREFVELLLKSYLVITDSGGLQEECTALGIPYGVYRESTERPSKNGEIIDDIGKFIEEMKDLKKYEKKNKPSDEFGDGNSVEKIVEIIRTI